MTWGVDKCNLVCYDIVEQGNTRGKGVGHDMSVM